MTQREEFEKDMAESANQLIQPERLSPKNMTVLVTGGAGFIGSHVAKRCLELGMHVVVIDDLSGGFEDQVPEGAKFLRGSASDMNFINDVFNNYDFHAVYALQAYAAEGLSHFVRKFNYENNLVSTINLINAAVNTGVKTFIFTSSIAVYGDQEPPFTETQPVTPADPYGISKWACECDIRAALEMFGLNYVIFRPGNVYGEHQNIGDKYRNVIGIFMNQIMQGKPLTVFGDGNQTRAFSYIDDVAPHIAKSALMPEIYNNTFNIGGAQHYSINELINVLSSEFGVTPEIKYLAARLETQHAYSDQSKSISVFGRPQWSLRDGVAKMAEWVRSVGPRKSREFDNIEIRKNLPEGW